MKLVFISLLLLAVESNAQKIALIDTRLKKPVSYTDSFTTSDVFKNLFPIYCTDRDSIIHFTTEMARYIDRKNDKKSEIDSFRVGNTLLVNKIECEDHRTYYSLGLKTHTKSMSIYVDIMDKIDSKRKAQLSLIEFADYIQNSLSY